MLQESVGFGEEDGSDCAADRVGTRGECFEDGAVRSEGHQALRDGAVEAKAESQQLHAAKAEVYSPDRQANGFPMQQPPNEHHQGQLFAIHAKGVAVRSFPALVKLLLLPRPAYLAHHRGANPRATGAAHPRLPRQLRQTQVLVIAHLPLRPARQLQPSLLCRAGLPVAARVD